MLGEPDVLHDQLRGHRGTQAHLGVDVVGGEPWGIGWDDEAADPLLGPRPDDGDIGDSTVGDPHLRAVEYPIAAVPLGVCPHRSWVRAGVGLGETEAADHLTGGHPREPLLLLLLRAEPPDGEHRQRTLNRDEAAGPCVARLEFDAGQSVGGGAGPGAAVALEVHPEQPEGAHLLGQIAGKSPLLVPGSDVGQDPVGHEPSHRVAQQALLVVEQPVDSEEVPRVGRRGWDISHESSIPRQLIRRRSGTGGVTTRGYEIGCFQEEGPWTCTVSK